MHNTDIWYIINLPPSADMYDFEAFFSAEMNGGIISDLDLHDSFMNRSHQCPNLSFTQTLSNSNREGEQNCTHINPGVFPVLLMAIIWPFALQGLQPSFLLLLGIGFYLYTDYNPPQRQECMLQLLGSDMQKNLTYSRQLSNDKVYNRFKKTEECWSLETT